MLIFVARAFSSYKFVSNRGEADSPCEARAIL
jgi:hypothetical protein